MKHLPSATDDDKTSSAMLFYRVRECPILSNLFGGRLRDLLR
jgi:hypothetical protein